MYLTSAGRLVAFLACAFAYTTRLNKTATRALSKAQGGRTREWDSRIFETHYRYLVQDILAAPPKEASETCNKKISNQNTASLSITMLVHQSEISLAISQQNMLLRPPIWFSSPPCPCKDICLQIFRWCDDQMVSRALTQGHRNQYSPSTSNFTSWYSSIRKRSENGIGCHGPHQVRMMA